MNKQTTRKVGLLGAAMTLVLSAPWSLAQNPETPAPGANPPRRFRPGPQGGNPQNPGGNRNAFVLDALNLSPEARAKMEAELKTFDAEMQKLRDAHNKRLEAVLTPAQLEQYRSMSQRGPGGFGGPGGRGGFGGPGGPGGGGRGFGRMDPQQMIQRMKTELSLTAAQEGQIGKILQDSQARMESLRGSFNPETGDRQAMFAQMQAINRDRMEKINAVLNAEQRAKWQTLQPTRPGGPGGPGGPRPGCGGAF